MTTPTTESRTNGSAGSTRNHFSWCTTYDGVLVREKDAAGKRVITDEVSFATTMIGRIFRAPFRARSARPSCSDTWTRVRTSCLRPPVRAPPQGLITITHSDGTHEKFLVQRVEKVAKTSFPTAEVYGATGYAELRIITCGRGIGPSGPQLCRQCDRVREPSADRHLSAAVSDDRWAPPVRAALADRMSSGCHTLCRGFTMGVGSRTRRRRADGLSLLF